MAYVNIILSSEAWLIIKTQSKWYKVTHNKFVQCAWRDGTKLDGNNIQTIVKLNNLIPTGGIMVFRTRIIMHTKFQNECVKTHTKSFCYFLMKNLIKNM